MATTAEQLLTEFEALPIAEKQVFARIIMHRLPPIESGDVTDEELCAAGDALSAMLDEEET